MQILTFPASSRHIPPFPAFLRYLVCLHSAAATPAVIFPVLINLAQKHLKKLRGSNAGLVVFYEKQLTELCSRIGEQYPAHMNLPQQGSFQLGYYCQTQARYQKKEEAKDV